MDAVPVAEVMFDAVADTLVIVEILVPESYLYVTSALMEPGVVLVEQPRRTWRVVIAASAGVAEKPTSPAAASDSAASAVRIRFNWFP